MLNTLESLFKLARNRKRDRTLPEKLVNDSWKSVQNNLGKFQALFGSGNMLIVDNSEFKDFPSVSIIRSAVSSYNFLLL